MDLPVLLALVGGLLIILIILLFLKKKSQQEEDVKPQVNRVVQPQRAQEGIPRRAQIARNQRNRLRQQQVEEVANEGGPVDDVFEDSDDEDAGEAKPHVGAVPDDKMGAKKRAKLEAKVQKRLYREQELRHREEMKAKEAKMEEERKLQQEREAEEERKQAEAERLAKEKLEREEHERYLKMKQAFSIEEEGFDEIEDEKENALSDFIQYIKDNKVVVLEDLANEFKLKTQKAIERIQELQENGSLTGVIDDRGKFIYVSEEELAAVAKFIKQRGRVSITELAECSNNLINLTPVSTESS